MILDSYSAIFVHIPKTGGTSIANSLGGNFASNTPGKEWDNYGIEKHATLSEIRSQIPPNKFKSYFKFAFVRNPFDQLVAHFFHRLRTKQMPNSFNSPYTFSRFIFFLSASGDSGNFIIQNKYITTENPSDNLDFIGRFETIEQDFSSICNKLGVSNLPLPHYNKNPHPHYRECYNRETKQIAENLLQADLAAFGYSF